MGQENVCQTIIWTLVLIRIVSQATASAVLDTACQTEPSLESLCGVIKLPSCQEIQLVPMSLRNNPQTPLTLLESFGTWNFVCTYPDISESTPPSVTSSDQISTSSRVNLASTSASTDRQSPTLQEHGEWKTTDVSTSKDVTTMTMDESSSGASIQITDKGGTTTHISIHTLLSGHETTVPYDPDAPAVESTTVLVTDVTQINSEEMGVTEVTSTTLNTDLSSSRTTLSGTVSDRVTTLSLPFTLGSVPSTTVKNENNFGTTPGVTTLRNSASTTSYPTSRSELATIDGTRSTLDPSSTPSEPDVVVGGHWPSQSTPATTTPQDTVVTTDTDEKSPSTSTHTTTRMSTITEAAYVTTDDSGSPQSTSVYDSNRTSTPERTTTDLPESSTSSGRYSATTEMIGVTAGSTTALITTGQFSTQTSTAKTMTDEASTTTEQTGTCPSGFVSFGNKCYFFLPAHLTSYMKYADAEDFCANDVSDGLADNYATLLTINSLEENQFLMSHLAGVQDIVDIVGSDGVWVNCDLDGRFDCNLDYDSIPSWSPYYYYYYIGWGNLRVILSLEDGLWYSASSSDLAFVVCQITLSVSLGVAIT